MGIGASIFLLAVGAILTFAVEVEASGLNINTIGVILMVCGAVGLVLTLVVFGRSDRTVGEERIVTRERDVL